METSASHDSSMCADCWNGCFRWVLSRAALQGAASFRKLAMRQFLLFLVKTELLILFSGLSCVFLHPVSYSFPNNHSLSSSQRLDVAARLRRGGRVRPYVVR